MNEQHRGCHLIDSLKTQLQIPYDSRGLRFDAVLAELMPEHSRARIQGWIKDGQILLNGQVVKAREKLLGGETVELLSLELKPVNRWEAQSIPLDIVYEDSDILIINKPAGLVVHPAAGNPDGTLVNALLHHYPELNLLPRAGIVHRLDKDTTGLMVVARSPEAHTSLVVQLQDRSMGRQYEAVVMGEVTGGGTIDFPIGRHPKNRLKMAVVPSGKPAFTEYTPLKAWSGLAHLRLKLRTGRTHQIRVHLAYVRLPIIGDPLYSANHRLPRGLDTETLQVIQSFGRQALHARRLELVHPRTGEIMAWEVDLPQDMQALIEQITKWHSGR